MMLHTRYVAASRRDVQGLTKLPATDANLSMHRERLGASYSRAKGDLAPLDVTRRVHM